MASEAILRIKVITDAAQAAAGLDKTEASAGKFARGVKKAALPAAAVGAAVLALGKKSLDAASDLQQAQGAVEAVFGKGLAKQVEKDSQAAAKAMGLSAAQYQNYAALVGGSLQAAGMSASKSVGESNKLIQRGADLAATYGGTTADAVEAINAAVSRSEFDPLEKFNVQLNMTSVNAELAARGQDKLTGKQLAAAKSAIVLEQIYAKSSKTAGQYAREADSVAGRTQSMGAEWTNAAAALGEVLLPVVSKAIAYLSDFAGWAQKNTTTVQILAGVLLGLSAAVLTINAVMKVAAAVQLVYNGAMKLGTSIALGTRIQLWALAAAEKAQAVATMVAVAATRAWALATRLLSAAWIASPIGVVVLIILAIAAALVIAYRRSSTFRAFVQGMWAGISAAAQAAWRVIKVVWDAILNAGKAAIDWLRANWQYALAGILLGPFGIAAVYIAKHFDKVKQVARAAFGVVKSAARALGSALRAIFSAAFSAVVQVVRRQMAAVRTAIGLVRTAVSKVAQFVRATFAAAWRIATTTAKSQLAFIRTALTLVRTAVSNVVTYVKTKLGSAFSSAKTAAVKAISAITNPVDTLKSAIDGVISKVQSLISWLGKIKVPKISLPKIPGLSKVVGAAAPAVVGRTAFAARAATGTSVPVARAGLGATAGAVINIQVSGALDPEAVARQIQRVLGGHDRRVGLRTA